MQHPDAARSLHFERHVLPHLDAAYGLARWLARAEHDAEDVLQEAMLRAYRYYGSGGRDNARAWLLAIVRNTFYTLRTQVPAVSLVDEFDEAIHGGEDDVPTPESLLLRDADAQQLRGAIEQLPLEFRVAPAQPPDHVECARLVVGQPVDAVSHFFLDPLDLGS